MNRLAALCVFFCVVHHATAAAVKYPATNTDTDSVNELISGAERLHELVEDMLVPTVHSVADTLKRGICRYKGLCRSNPAKSCVEIITQEGVRNQTSLSDGKYWLQLETVQPDGSSLLMKDPVQVDCVMTNPWGQGAGWMLLFDDSGRERIIQQFHPVLANVRCKEVLAFTPEALDAIIPRGRSMYLYNVDESHPDHATSKGYTPNQMLFAPWVGQDDFGKKVGGAPYPGMTNHFRFKYFGKPGANAADTLFVLDDGDIGPAECRTPENKGTCYGDSADSLFAQVCYSPRGLISFGCSAKQENFTQCGSCLYEGYGAKKAALRRSVVRKMYIR